MKIKSKITGKIYDNNHVIYISDKNQNAAYWANDGLEEILDILYDKTKGKYIFIYPYNEKMSNLYKMWIERKLDW